MLPVLGIWLRDIGLEYESDFFEDVRRAHLDRNLAIWGEMRLVVGWLNEAGIEPVLLKGSALLAAGVYEDLGHRYLIDVDLLVGEEQVGVAAGLLRARGYGAEDRDAWGYFRHHYPPLSRPGSVAFEIHHRMGLARCERVLGAREVMAGSRAAVVDGMRVRIPCPEHLVAHLVLHSQLQGAYNERVWPPMRAFVDLAMLQRKYGEGLEWGRVVERFRRAGCYRLLALHLMRVEEVLGPGFRERVKVDAVTRVLWKRRQVLRARPWLRYWDAGYMFGTVLGKRLAVLRGVLGTRAGLRHVLGQVVAPGNYLRLWTDLMEGRGR